MSNTTLESKSRLKTRHSLTTEEAYLLQISRILTEPVNAQMQDISYRRFAEANPDLLDDPFQLFWLFRQTPAYDTVRQAAVEEQVDFLDGVSRNSLKGMVHEELGALVFASKIAVEARKTGKVQMVLSPKGTKTFFQKLFPGHKLVSTGFQTDMVDGVTVPDGLLLEWDRGDGIWRVEGFCEYTTALAEFENIHASKTADAIRIFREKAHVANPIFYEGIPLYWISPQAKFGGLDTISSYYTPSIPVHLGYSRDQLDQFLSRELLTDVDRLRGNGHQEASQPKKPWAKRRHR